MSSAGDSAQMKNFPRSQTEFMVDVEFGDSAKSLGDKFNDVDFDLTNEVSGIPGALFANSHIGQRTRLNGEDDLLVSSAIANSRGPTIFGLVRFTQINIELTRIEAIFTGLLPGKHPWSINEFGDLTKGTASTGKIFNPTKVQVQPLGDLGTLDANEKGVAFYMNVKQNIKVSDIIGRSVVIYGSEGKSGNGISAAVIARTAAVCEKYKIWEASDADILISKM